MKVITGVQARQTGGADQMGFTRKISVKDPLRVFFSPSLWLLGLWMVMGAMLRLSYLDGKPLWTDEFSTLVFSLGNGFQGVPVDQVMSLSTLLAPLQHHGANSFGDVLDHLLRESNHPPLFFLLIHGWIDLWQPDGTQVSVWVVRSLPAIFGILAIPAIYSLSAWVFASQIAGHCAAVMMAVSPLGIYLAQEARHYTLGILWVIASLACWLWAIRQFYQGIPLSKRGVFLWIGINGLGIATHYFFVLTLGAEGIVLGIILWRMRRRFYPRFSLWMPRLMVVFAGTLVSGLVWVPVFLSNQYGSQLTAWIERGDVNFLAQLMSPFFQALAGWITMISLLPVESSSLPVIVGSVIIMFVFFMGFLPWLIVALKMLGGWGGRTLYFYRFWRGKSQVLMVRAVAGFILSSLTIFAIFTYVLGIDLTRGARYHFVYFPAVILLLGAILAVIWQLPVIERLSFLPWKATGKTVVILVFLMGLGSGITVISNLGYQKYYRPDLLVHQIQESYRVPVLVATPYQTHVQTGELMSIAWQWQQGQINGEIEENQEVKFWLIKGEKNSVKLDSVNEGEPLEIVKLKQGISQLEQPVDLWLVNFQEDVNLISETCQRDLRKWPGIDGYRYQVYHCG